MLSFLTKKKVTEEKLADIFVTNTLSIVEESFADVALLLNEDPDLIKSPEIKDYDYNKFLLIVLAGNLHFIPKHFHDYQDVRLLDCIYTQLSKELEVDRQDLKKAIADYQSYFSRINAPSKNMIYAMAKAVFFRYNLNDCQEDYFRKANTPNPLIHKRLCDMMQNFLWDWEMYQEKFKIVN